VSKLILLADDHLLFRQGLSALLSEQPDWEIVGEAEDGAKALELAQQHRPDVVVLDIAMPKMSGIEAAQAIRKTSPNTRIVALSMYGESHYVDQMFEAGASAYVLKNEAIGELVRAIQAALRGARFISPAIVQNEALTYKGNLQNEKPSLTKRETEVLRLLADGLKTREIAETLNLSVKTIETYRARIMTKVGINNIAGLVKFALKAGITSPYY